MTTYYNHNLSLHGVQKIEVTDMHNIYEGEESKVPCWVRDIQVTLPDGGMITVKLFAEGPREISFTI